MLLPPSETKAAGGSGVLDAAALGFPSLRGRRRTAAAALKRVPLKDAPGVLELGARNAHEARWNRGLTSGPVLPAVERYTGVLYDGLGVATLSTPGPALGRRARRDRVRAVRAAARGRSDPAVPAVRARPRCRACR